MTKILDPHIVFADQIHQNYLRHRKIRFFAAGHCDNLCICAFTPETFLTIVVLVYIQNKSSDRKAGYEQTNFRNFIILSGTGH